MTSAAQWLVDLTPRVLPARWQPLGPSFFRPDSLSWRNLHEALTVIMSIDDMGDFGQWHHVSVAGEIRLPSWRQLVQAKELWMGDVLAVQVLPPRMQYVNMHEHCLHLWRRLDEPMFSWLDGTP